MGDNTIVQWMIMLVVLTTMMWAVDNRADPRFGTLLDLSQMTRGYWSGPVSDVEVVREEGDRFRPVHFRVTPHPKVAFSYSATLGRVVRSPDGLLVYGTGETGDGVLTIAGYDYDYRIVAEPTCDQVSGRDCYGETMTNRSNRFIHYGLDDQTVVEWELAWVHWERDAELRVSSDRAHITKARSQVDQMNEILERSGVYIRIVLTEVYDWEYPNSLDSFRGGVKHIQADVIVGYGVSYSGSCGVAYLGTNMDPNTRDFLYGFSRCGADTTLHEIGHSASLHHGPYNSANAGTGRLYPEFGHGTMRVCGFSGSVLSYGSSRNRLSNPLMTCEDGSPAGSLESNSAYVLNMIRYNVSLFHDDHESLSITRYGNLPETGDLIID